MLLTDQAAPAIVARAREIVSQLDRAMPDMLVAEFLAQVFSSGAESSFSFLILESGGK